jgi:hypothetical protein
VYSGKQIVNGDLCNFASNKSFLLRNRIIDVSVNHLLLHIESKSFRLSCIRFCASKPKIIRSIRTESGHHNTYYDSSDNQRDNILTQTRGRFVPTRADTLARRSLSIVHGSPHAGFFKVHTQSLEHEDHSD